MLFISLVFLCCLIFFWVPGWSFSKRFSKPPSETCAMLFYRVVYYNRINISSSEINFTCEKLFKRKMHLFFLIPPAAGGWFSKGQKTCAMWVYRVVYYNRVNVLSPEINFTCEKLFKRTWIYFVGTRGRPADRPTIFKRMENMRDVISSRCLL